MKRFFLPESSLASSEMLLRPESAHHLFHVLRARSGDTVVVFNGAGSEVTCIVREGSGGEALLAPIEPPRATQPPPPIHLLLALTKGPAMDAAVRMATEAGVTHIHPLVTARSVARGERVDRWVRIAISAAQQSRRPTVPEIAPVADFSDGLRAIPPSYDRRVAVPGGPRLCGPTGGSAVLVGPEGGLSQSELTEAVSLGFTPLGLGRFILRVETAAAVAIALLSV